MACRSRNLNLRPVAQLATLFAIAGLILLPALIFVFGVLFAGSYEGSSGVFGFLGDLYADLLRGRPLAWAIAASPAALAGTWWLVARFAFRRRPEPGAEAGQ